MPELEYKFVFLVYVARSGSTFLAKQLSECSKEVLVLPETKLIDNLIAVTEPSFEAMSNDEKIDLITRDPRWENLDISESQLVNICKRSETRASIIQNIISHKAESQGKEPKYIVVKNGASVWRYLDLDRFFNDIVFLHIKRDVRGSTASRMNKMPVYKKKAGVRVEDAWFLAKFWRSFVRQILRIQNAGIEVYEIVYEELVESPREVIGAFLSHNNISFELRNNHATDEFKNTSNSYKLTEIEKQTKHNNVMKPAMSSRADAWKDEMSLSDGVVVECLTRNYLSTPYFILQVTKVKMYYLLVVGFLRHGYFSVVRFKEKYLFRA